MYLSALNPLNMKRHFSTIFLLLSVFFANAQKIKFPDGKLKYSIVCGGNCAPGNLGIPFVFKEYYAPNVNDASNDTSIAMEVLGHIYPENDLRGELALPCSRFGVNPFSKADISAMGNKGREMDYKWTAKSNLNVEASVKKNMNEIKTSVTDSIKLKQAEQEIRAAYQRFRGKTFEVGGTYYEWGLNANAISAFFQKDTYDSCKKYMEQKGLRIITAVGFVRFDIKFEQTSLDSIATALQAALNKHGINANISVSFKREVSSSLKASTPSMFAIVSWRSVGKGDYPPLY